MDSRRKRNELKLFVAKRFGVGLCAGALCLFTGAGPALAADEHLIEEIDRIKNRLSTIESGRATPGEEAPVANWFDRVTISGVVQVEGSLTDNDDVDTESDVSVATVELGVDTQLSDYSAAHVHLLYEDDPGTLDVEEATITLGNPEKFPLFLTAGKMYVPFGYYESLMLTDPYTLELGETNEGAVKIGIEAGGFRAAVFTFNGDTSDGGSDIVEHSGASVGFGIEKEGFRLDLGGNWISSIRDSDGLFEATGGVAPHHQGANDYVEGVAAHLVIGAGPLTLIGEYVAALDDLNGADTNSAAKAFSLEAGVTFPLGSVGTVIGAAYQETEEAEWMLAEKRFMAAVTFEIMPKTVLVLEWMNEEDYKVNGGLDWDVYTMQLGVEF